jgi:hypothetical protein
MEQEKILAYIGEKAYSMDRTKTEHRSEAPMSHTSTLATSLPATILETILARLALLFLTGTGGDLTAARQAAIQMLASYHPETEDELRLAAQIVGFSFQALEALSQSASHDLPLTRILRLRGCAVSLSRESHKAQRRLDQIQQARRAGSAAQPAAPAAPYPKIEKAVALIADTRQVAAVAKNTGQTWTQAYRQRERARRMTKNLKKNQAAHLSAVAAANDGSAPAPSPA